jgi:hypothetical protein
VCGKESVSDDHVPPRMVFPEQKDTGGVDYRKNLATVPACRAHNEAFSADDTYFAFLGDHPKPAIQDHLKTGHMR